MTEVEFIALLAQEVEHGDPIDWDYLLVKEEDAYLLMASECVNLLKQSETPVLTAYAVITKLLVENFVLNLKLQNKLP